MPNYTYATLADAQLELFSRLYESATEPSQQMWPAAELTVYVVEALRSWNALTSFWRSEFSFNLTQGVNWYDIPSLAGTLRPFTVTDQYLANTLEYHLLEPLTSLTPTPLAPATWTGSAQFSLFAIYGALTRRQNDTLGATGCNITRRLVSAPLVRTGIVLSDRTLDIRRVAWVPGYGLGYDTQIMRQTDAWAKRAFDGGYLSESSRSPETWLQNTQPPPRFDVDFVPPVPGEYETLTVESGITSLDTAAQLLSVPDDWSWVVKWGALSDLLGRESNAQDLLRADYCLKRYREGLMLMGSSPSVLAVDLNGVPVSVDAVKNGDNFNPSWQSLTQGEPQGCYVAGLNLVGFRTPDAGPYGALLSVVENAPVPVLDTDYIQVDRGNYDVILDEAQHLAAFKEGGRDFLETMPLHQNFMSRAALYNAKLRAMGQFQAPEYRISQREQDRNPRLQIG